MLFIIHSFFWFRICIRILVPLDTIKQSLEAVLIIGPFTRFFSFLPGHLLAGLSNPARQRAMLLLAVEMLRSKKPGQQEANRTTCRTIASLSSSCGQWALKDPSLALYLIKPTHESLWHPPQVSWLSIIINDNFCLPSCPSNATLWPDNTKHDTIIILRAIILIIKA